MEITLRYGREGLPVTLPDGVDVVTTHFVPGLPDETMAIREALPLSCMIYLEPDIFDPQHPDLRAEARG